MLISRAVPDLYDDYTFKVPSDALRLDAYVRLLQIDGGYGDWSAAANDAAQVSLVWSRFRPFAAAQAPQRPDILGSQTAVTDLDANVAALGQAVAARDGATLGTKAADGLNLIDTLEHEWYDYASKYDEDGMELIVPPPGLSHETIDLLQQRAVESFIASECEGLARVDFFVREADGEVVLNELNTMPGFTSTSVWARLFEASGVGYAEALDRLVKLALERHDRRSKLVY